MRVNLEAFLGLVPGDQLDLGIGEPFDRQEGQHLMTKQMRMHGLRDARLLAVALHDLLDAAARERPAATDFKEVAMLGSLLQMAFVDEVKARGKQDVAASGALAAWRRGGMSTCRESMISPKSGLNIPSVSSPQN